MKILVPVKRVPDYEAKIKINPSQNGIITEGIKWIVNPFDEIAVEEAIKIRDGGGATEVVLVGIGPEDVATQLRYGMAMGADRGVLVRYEGEVDSDLASRILQKVFEREAPHLVIMGKQAIDSDANQTAQLLAERLSLPQACFASKVVLSGSSATVTREVDGGLETLEIPTPCVISTDLRLNEPRYASLPGIMKAKKKQLDELQIGELGIDTSVKVRVVKMTPPAARSAGRKVADVSELIAVLQNEAKVL